MTVFILSLHQHAPYRPCPQQYSKATQTQAQGTISQYGSWPCLEYSQQLVRISSSSFPVGHLVAYPQRRCSHCGIHDVHRPAIEELSKAYTTKGGSKDHGDVRQAHSVFIKFAHKFRL